MWLILIVCCTKILNMYTFVNKNLPPPRLIRRGQEEKENRLALYREECLKRDVQMQTLKEKHQNWVQKFRNNLVDKRRFMNNKSCKDKFIICSDDEDDYEIDKNIVVPSKIQQKTEELEQLCGMSDYSSNSSNSIENADKINNNYSGKFKLNYHNQKQQQQQHQQKQQPKQKQIQQQQLSNLNNRDSKYCQPAPLKSILKKPLSSLNTNLNSHQVSGKDKKQQTTKFAQQPKNTQTIKKPSIKLVEDEVKKSKPLSIYSALSDKNINDVDTSPKLNNIDPSQKFFDPQNGNFELSEEFLKANCDIVAKNLDKLYYGPINYCEKSTKQAQLNRYLYNCCDSLKNNPFFVKASPENKWSFRGSSGKMSSPAECDTTNNNTGQYAALNCSIASSQDFTHDNSDYQWFVDYGFRDGVQHNSILSSLSASYSGIGDISLYDEMGPMNIDANVAEVDMENFRNEDILLKIQQQREGLDNANIRSGRKLILKDQNEFDNSICKPVDLFSPCKTSQHISVDSLDMDGYPDEGDIILTCQANKNNYTIAFEGSYMYSDESYYDIPENKVKHNNSLNLDNIIRKKAMDTSMSQSDTGFTTWSKLKKTSNQLPRCPSGNNNNSNLTNTSHIVFNNNNNLTNKTIRHMSTCSAVRKSSSMPNLKANQQLKLKTVDSNAPQLNVSYVVSSNSSNSKLKTMLPLNPSASSDTNNEKSSSNNEEKAQNPPSFNLVKLFIKQKSSSTDTCMDVSSGCWPSDSTNSSTEHPTAQPTVVNVNSNSFRNRKKSMNDSGKCSALSKHDEDADEYQYDSLDPHINAEKKTNDFNREIFDSPTHKRNYKDYSLNIKNQQLKHPALFNLMNNNSINSQHSQNSLKETASDASKTSENLTQIFTHDKTRVIDMITKSIQTSSILMQQNKESQTKSQVRQVPPSFLSQLSKRGDQSGPVFVIYPSYVLPDLEFIYQQPPKIQRDIVISPLDFKDQFNMAKTLSYQQQPKPILKKRPHSLNIENMQKQEYIHVQDPQSLVTLLPRGYRKLLARAEGVDPTCWMKESQTPMFCQTPPISRNTSMMCDCARLIQQQTPDSSSGSSTQPPSSGYRGSSTLLTDSEMNILEGNDLKNLFVYQYDNLMENVSDLPPSGRKGILRRNNTTTNTPSRVGVHLTKPKRNSMFEKIQENKVMHPQKLSPQQTVQDKRRSLQEPNYYNPQDIENYLKQKEDKDLNQLLTELELHKALSNKNPYHNHQNDPEMQEIEARLKAENYLNSIPKSELKHYVEIANLMELTQDHQIDTNKLKNDISRTIASRKVTFNPKSPAASPVRNQKTNFTPPTSPVVRRELHLDNEKQGKIEKNKFKRLQIQWERLSGTSEISSQPHERKETQSGGSTPTGASKVQSKIPRPVSYPTTTKQTPEHIAKTPKSPSRIVPPKKYSTISPGSGTITSPTTGIPRTPSKINTTPKKTLPVRSATRTR